MGQVEIKEEVKKKRLKRERGWGGNQLIIRSIYLAGVFALSCFLLLQSIRSIKLTNQKVNIFELAQVEVDKLRLENITLLQEKDTVMTDDYIQTIARNRLNYSKEGEISFVIPPELLEDPILDQYLESFAKYEVDGGNNSLKTEKNFFKSWVDFFIKGV